MRDDGLDRTPKSGLEDEEIVHRYVERTFGKGAHLVMGENAPNRDEMLISGFASARDYFKQSLGCRRADGMPFRVHAALVDTIKPNAFATERRGLHICGMNAGLYVAIFELCNFVMAQPGVFSEVGDPDREVAASLPEGVIPGFWVIDQTRSHGRIVDPSLAPTIVPKCPDRYSFAVYMTLHMMRFVWFHELYHCLNGHVGALRQFARNVRLNEFPDESAQITMLETGKGPLPIAERAFRHAIELDADRSALWGAFRTQAEDKENIIALQALSRAARLKLCLFTAYFMTHLMDEIGRRLGIQESSTHPDSYTRIHNLIRTTATHMIDVEPNIRASFLEVIEEFRSLKQRLPSVFDADKLLNDCQSGTYQYVIDKNDDNLELARIYFSKMSFS